MKAHPKNYWENTIDKLDPILNALNTYDILHIIQLSIKKLVTSHAKLVSASTAEAAITNRLLPGIEWGEEILHYLHNAMEIVQLKNQPKNPQTMIPEEHLGFFQCI